MFIGDGHGKTHETGLFHAVSIQEKRNYLDLRTEHEHVCQRHLWCGCARVIPTNFVQPATTPLFKEVGIDYSLLAAIYFCFRTIEGHTEPCLTCS